jgi:hypothetical protein
VKLGRDARAVSAAGNWRCPRCEGDCPCSNCRRKAGKAPLGQLARAARAAGCDSVAHYLAGEI